jgi:hypothetical protein
MRYAAGFISAFYNPLKNPNAPTIGTATAGSGSASVAFTAPSDIGGSAITSYTAISTPGGFTGTAASSPITVTGLTGGTAYTFKVLATNSYGSSVFSAASNSVTPLLVIGQSYQGGFFAGQISTAGNGVADFNLVVGPVASAQTSGGSTQWKTTATSTTGTSSVIDGPTNSSNMNNASHPAAQFCKGLTIGGYSDWYSPARNELEICYFNLKPATGANSTSGGFNANSVPSRASTGYTNSGGSPLSPSQTSATVFQVGGAEAFSSDTSGYYWSSTETTTTNARGQYFGSGFLFSYNKTTAYRVRAVRRVAV